MYKNEGKYNIWGEKTILDEHPGNYVEWRKSYLKICIFYYLIYRYFWNDKILEAEERLVVVGIIGGGEIDVDVVAKAT